MKMIPAILAILGIALACGGSTKAVASDSEFVIVERKADEATKAKIKELFTKSRSFEIFYAPQESRVPLGKREVVERARYNFRVSCLSTCFEMGGDLVSALSEARRIRGKCPERFYAALRFYEEDGSIIDSGFVLSGGECIDLSFGSFYLSPEGPLHNVLEKLEHLAKK
jgi:hypothetical protein